MAIDNKTLDLLMIDYNFIKLISIETDLQSESQNSTNILDPFFNRKIAENNSDFEQILKRETECYNRQFGKNSEFTPITANDFKVKLIRKLKKKIEFIEKNSKNDYLIESGVSKAEEFLNYLKIRTEDTTISDKLDYIKTILPKANQYIFDNATIEDFENILRKTPPESKKRLVKKESASYNLVNDFFMSLFNKINFYIPMTTQLIMYVQMNKDSIKKARKNSSSKNESKRNKEKRKNIIDEIFKPIQ